MQTRRIQCATLIIFYNNVPLGFFAGFFPKIIRFARRKAKLRWAGVRAQCPVLHINEPKKTGARNARAWPQPSSLKVHKRENFLGSDIEICTFS